MYMERKRMRLSITMRMHATVCMRASESAA